MVVNSAGRTAATVGHTAAKPVKGFVYIGRKGTAFALRSTGTLFGLCADGLTWRVEQSRAEGEPTAPAPEPVDLNTAPPDALTRIEHIDDDRAEAIVGQRAEAPFASLDDLSRVPGIGPKRVEDIKAQGLAVVR